MRRRAGFSLVEVVMAVVIMGIVLSGAFLLLKSTYDVVDHLSDQQDEDLPRNRWEALSMQLRRDADGAQLPVKLEERVAFEADKQQVSWITLNAGGLPERCRYQFDATRKVIERVHGDLSRSVVVVLTTNEVLAKVESCEISWHDGSGWVQPEELTRLEELPNLLRIGVKKQGGEQEQRIDALFPVSLEIQQPVLFAP